MSSPSTEHFLSEYGGIVKDPGPADKVPLDCRSCKDGKLGSSENGRMTCNKCARVHGLIRIKEKVNYGVLL